jgi:hypothetical protein
MACLPLRDAVRLLPMPPSGRRMATLTARMPCIDRAHAMQDIAASSLLQLLHSLVLAPADADTERRDAVLWQVRQAAGSAAWATALVPALDALHAASEGGKAGMSALLKSTPEAMMVLMLRQAPERVRGRLHVLALCQPPRMPAVGEGGAKAGRAVAWHHAYLLDVLGRCAPEQLLEAIKPPLQEWDASSRQVRAGFGRLSGSPAGTRGLAAVLSGRHDQTARPPRCMGSPLGWHLR